MSDGVLLNLHCHSVLSLIRSGNEVCPEGGARMSFILKKKKKGSSSEEQECDQ